MAITETTVLTRNESPLTAAVDGELVMFKPDAGSYFALGDVGTEIWELIAQPIAVGALCDRLLERFDVDRDRCLVDVITFVDQLREADLVQTQM